MRDTRTFFHYACVAAAKQAGRTRREFLAGKINSDQFHAIRNRQKFVSERRIESVLARTIPGYVPRFT